MLRKSAAILALLLTCFASQVFALGLGTVSVESLLNQPLRARIEILQLGDTRLDDVRIQVAAPEDFVRFGIDRATFLNNIRFRTKSTPSGNFVVLTTNQIVREPYLSFILETRWSNGRLLSEHTILMDLPVFQDSAPAPAEPVRAPISTTLTPTPSPSNAPSTPRQQNQAQTAQQDSQSSQSVQPMLEPEDISPQSSSNTQVNEPASEIAQEPAATPEPLAQTQDEASEIDQESEVEVVATEEEPVAEPEEVVQEVAEESVEEVLEEEAEQAVEEVAVEQESAPEPEVEQTITTSASETLTDIALSVRPNQNVSIQQTMLAIQELNPDAFIGGNINRLRSDQVLRVPSLADIQAIDSRQAIDEVARQNRQIAQADVQPLAAPANTAPTQDSAPGQLSVVSGEPESEAPGAGASSNELDRRITELETQLALREEEADRARLEREEMESRLADLNEQIAAAQEILRLQDLQLAQLQQSLADAAAEAELAAQQAAAQVEVPPVVIRQPSLMDTLLSNSMLLIAGAGVLVLGLVMFLLRRNKSGNANDEELDEIDEEEFSGVTEKQESDKEAGGSEFQDYDEAELDSELDDILIEQENIKQAENLLKAAIEESPESSKLALKLLSVIALKGDLSAFEMKADELHGLNDPALDKEVNALRASLKTPTTKANTVVNLKDQKSQKERDDTASFLDDLGIDLDSFDDDDSFSEVDDSAKPAKPAAAPSVSLADLPDDPEPEEMDLTFDFADDPSDSPAEDDSNIAESETEILEDQQGTSLSDSADDALELESLEFGDDDVDEDAPALASGSSKDADELEIDSLDFDSPSSPEVKNEPAEETELDLETFAFDVPEPAAEKEEVEAKPEAPVADDNALDFDYDKTELEPAPAEAAPDEELETFDFDLNSSSKDTVIEKSDDEEISFDLDEDDELASEAIQPSSSDATIVESQSSSKEFDFDLSELEIDADEVDLDDDISLSDDDFLDLDDEETVGLTSETDDDDDDISFDFDDDLPASKPSAGASESEDDDDLNFLTDDDEDIDVSSISIDDDDDDSYTMSDEDETATKLELAYAYQKMGDADGAKEILLEVIKEGTESQIKEAKELIKVVEGSRE